MEYYFSSSSAVDTFPGAVIVSVDEVYNPLTAESLGFLRALSAEEPRHALVLSIARDIRRGATDEELMLWRRVVLSTIMEFRRLSSDAGFSDPLFACHVSCHDSCPQLSCPT